MKNVPFISSLILAVLCTSLAGCVAVMIPAATLGGGALQNEAMNGGKMNADSAKYKLPRTVTAEKFKSDARSIANETNFEIVNVMDMQSETGSLVMLTLNRRVSGFLKVGNISLTIYLGADGKTVTISSRVFGHTDGASADGIIADFQKKLAARS
ncbi:MAG: hypothetical protein PHV99_02940 [Candidatus Pacebacteria bacterium]|nr:hypothetical protein [Candidatus Paceibacterota bacterium]